MGAARARGRRSSSATTRATRHAGGRLVARPHRLRPRPAGPPEGWRALVDHALSGRPSSARRSRASPSWAARTSPRAPTWSAAPDGRGPGGPAARRPRPAGGAARPGPAGARRGARRHPHARGEGASSRTWPRRFPAQEAGRAAARALEGQAAAPAAPFAGLSGELDPYGLPALLHRLAQGRATGTLTLRPRDAAAPATFAFDQGRLVTARWGQREGADAVYQLLERPFAGTFAFESGAAPGAAGAASVPALETLIKEGMRRATELRARARSYPRTPGSRPPAPRPSTVPDEPDYELIVALWEKACSPVRVSPRWRRT